MTHSSKTVSKAFIDMLEQQEWKGNVRELRNVIERSLIVCESDELHPEDLPIEIQNATFKEKVVIIVVSNYRLWKTPHRPSTGLYKR